MGSSPIEISEFFQFTKSFQPHYGPGVYLASNRNEYQKIFLGVKHGWLIRLTTLLPSVSRLSEQCVILNISQPYRLARPVMRIRLLAV
jgi:hypothetical protein